MPKVSVIMGVYNCENTLDDAINCILKQSFSDWEMIICDDGSSDRTFEIALKYVCDKIKLLRNEKNRGLNYTLNKCLAYSNGEYIARMDGDDLCSEDRFLKEVNELDHHKEIAIVSCNMEYFDEDGVWEMCRKKEYPIGKDFLYETPFCHAPCMVRREAYRTVNGYTDEKRFLRVEDYHLWVKMYEAGFRGYNIQEFLYKMRDDRNAYRRRKFKYRLNESYVKILAVKKLKLPIYGYLFSIKPILVGLLPKKVYDFLHRARLNTRG